MAKESDLIVFDEEYSIASRRLREYSSALNEMLADYIETVRFINQAAIKDRRVSERLERLVGKAETLKNDLSTATEEVPGTCSSFVSEIDEADQFLY